jgi:hypothetical protein
VIARFGEDAEPALREQAAKALFNKGATLGALGRSDEAIAVYDDVVALSGADAEPAMREKADLFATVQQISAEQRYAA